MSDIRFQCRVCGQKLAVDTAAAGWEIRCPQCGAAQTVPAAVAARAVASESSCATPQPQPTIPELATRETSGGEEFEYAVFISYRHGEPDQTLARWLHTALETYRVPKRLVEERGLAPRLQKVFRDEEELRAAPTLSREIERALQQSRFLIVICSPRTPSSPWVNAEVEYFRRLGRDNQILALLLEGEPIESFPQALREIRRTTVNQCGGVKLTIEEVEPLAADVRPIRKEGSRWVRKMAKLRILSCLLGVPFDDLRRREDERERSRRLRLGALLATTALCFGAITAAYFSQRQLVSLAEKERGEKVELSRLRAEQAAQAARPPQFEEAQPVWLALADKAVAQRILDQRSAITNGLPTYTLIQTFELLGFSPPKPTSDSERTLAPAAAARVPEGGRLAGDATGPKLPEKFWLQGFLAGVRQEGGRAYVYLRSHWDWPVEANYSRSASEPRWMTAMVTSRNIGKAMGEAALLACVVFEGRDVVPNMADYRIGQPISLVVQRRNWAHDTPSPLPGVRPVPGPMNSSRQYVWTIDKQNEYSREFCWFGDTDVLFWCGVGTGVEKAELPDTWIDPAFGRTERDGNKDALRRSPGTMLRDPSKCIGTRGLLEAKFVCLLPWFPATNWSSFPPRNFAPVRPKDPDPVFVVVRIADSVEGSITVVADLGTNVTAREFWDYTPGITLQADATLQGTFERAELLWPMDRPSLRGVFLVPRPSPSNASAGREGGPYFRQLDRDPLAPPLAFKCSWIRIKGKPATLVFADGPRRQGGARKSGGSVFSPATNKNSTIKPAGAKSSKSPP